MTLYAACASLATGVKVAAQLHICSHIPVPVAHILLLVRGPALPVNLELTKIPKGKLNVCSVQQDATMPWQDRHPILAALHALLPPTALLELPFAPLPQIPAQQAPLLML